MQIWARSYCLPLQCINQKTRGMNIKLFLAAIAGAVVSFLLGWLIYGLLLMDFFQANTIVYEGLFTEMPNMFLLILSNLLMSFFIAFIFQRWAGFTTFIKGLCGGAFIGFFVAAAIDLSLFSMMNLYTPAYVIVDIVLYTIMTGIIGGVIAMILGSGKKAVP